MKKALSVLLLLVLLLPSAALADEVVNVFNWEDYIDEAVLEMFTAETGIKVNYMNFTTVEDMIVQVEANPGAFDLCFPSDYIIERMINKNMLAEINFDNVPNAALTIPYLQNPAYDPDQKYSVPYLWGTVGILYNTTMVDDPVDSWDIMWNTKYSNNVFMLDSIRDSMGITLKYLGYSMNTQDIPAIMAAKQKLIEQKQSGVVKAYQVDETKDKMVAGEAALALVWSGDAQYAIDLNPDLAYAVPQEGSNVWVDGMVIPKDAKNKANAEKLIDFLCRPEIAKMNCEYVRYACPNTGAIELMGDVYTSNPVQNAPAEVLEKCEFFNDIEPAFLSVYEAMWMEVKNTK
ncbi:MAG: spermidine/putrescine ABC transporter substrate-binding protein [Clostridia bacterium]|nr:spermidine/putrescine ABC transporter substrate-binding protein [Clostridia bacterium]